MTPPRGNSVLAGEPGSGILAAGAFVRLFADGGPRWAWLADRLVLLPQGTDLASLLRAVVGELAELVAGGESFDPSDDSDSDASSDAAAARLLAPVDDDSEVWAAGVTYERSRQARMEESTEPDIYQRVYDATRPELFFKSVGWRVRGPGQSISVRCDSAWNVPEPELAVVLRADRSVFGWTICNDVSSRTIEGENPLYLPQAKVYLGACAVGPGIVPAAAIADPYDLTMSMTIERDGALVWSGESNTAQLRRRVGELAEHLFAADVFPHGVVLSTGTSLVPDEPFTLLAGDVVRIAIDGLGELSNPVVAGLPEWTA